MILYASMSSDETKVIRFYIETFKISCDFRDLDKENAEETKNSLLLKNPAGVLPCLEESDKCIFGVVPVLLYLAEEHASFAMCGSSLETRSKVESVLMWASTSLSRSVYYNFAAPRLFESHSIGEFQNMSLISLGKDEIAEHFDRIENCYLGNNNTAYLVSNKLSIADVYTATTIAALEPLLFDFSPWPLLCKWFERVQTDMTKTSHENLLTKLLSRARVL